MLPKTSGRSVRSYSVLKWRHPIPHACPVSFLSLQIAALQFLFSRCHPTAGIGLVHSSSSRVSECAPCEQPAVSCSQRSYCENPTGSPPSENGLERGSEQVALITMITSIQVILSGLSWLFLESGRQGARCRQHCMISF